jgi:hypothetical protein
MKTRKNTIEDICIARFKNTSLKENLRGHGKLLLTIGRWPVGILTYSSRAIFNFANSSVGGNFWLNDFLEGKTIFPPDRGPLSFSFL